MQDGAVHPRLGILGFDLDGLIVQCSRHIPLAFVAQQIGQIGQGQGIVGMADQGRLIMKLGAIEVAALPPGRAQGQLQFGAFGLPGDGRGSEARWRHRTGHWRATGWTD